MDSVNVDFFDSAANGVELADCAAVSEAKCVVRLIEQHRTALVSHVKRILGCSGDAEDVVQETCVRLMRVRDFWRGERQVRAFLFKIATNLARDELRRRRACFYGAHVPFDGLNIPGDALQPDELVDGHLAMAAVGHALRSLPPRHREVFNLHIVAQLSYRAIAKRLGISAKTVERDMSSARELCQERLASPIGSKFWQTAERHP
jgi:RNA polymerase sigma-70 factor (ECF subfamily)